MIRVADLLALAWRKLAARKVTTLFSVLAVSLGVALVTTFTSLVSPVRQLVTRATMLFAPVRGDVVVVQGKIDKDKPPDEEKRLRLFGGAPELTDDDRTVLTALPHVRAVADPVNLEHISFDIPRCFAYANPDVWGVPVEFMDRYWDPSVPRTSITSAVPVVMGRHRLGITFDEQRQIFCLDPTFDPKDWLGREIPMTVGDNYSTHGPYTSDWEEGRFRYRRQTDDEYKKERLRDYNNLACRYDMLIFDKTLELRAVIVGFHHLERTLMPEDVARDLQRWMSLRADLASLEGRAEATTAKMKSGNGASKPPRQPVRYGALRLLVDDEANVDTVIADLESRSYRFMSRQTMLRETLTAFDQGATIARRASYAVGAVLLVMAGMLVWLIIGKSVVDSRREIGLLRALGATKRTILHGFMVEAGMLGVMGGLLGLLEGFGLAWGISTLSLWAAHNNLEKLETGGQIYRVQEFLPQSLHAFEPEAGVVMLVVTVCIACLAGVVPALRAARLDPVEALRND